jgi:hypothetical protein
VDVGDFLAILAAWGPCPVSNDFCATATVVDEIPFVEVVDVTTYTTEPDDPAQFAEEWPQSKADFKKQWLSAWYEITPTVDLEVQVTADADYDAILHVWEGQCGGPLAAVGRGSQSAQTCVFLAADVPYLIEVTSPSPDQGGLLQLSVDPATCPPITYPPSNSALPNDFCDAAPEIAAPFHDEINTADATEDPDDIPASCGGGGGGPTVWYSYRAEEVDELVTVATCGSNYDTVISVWTNCGIEAVEVACNDDFCETQAVVSWPAIAGQTYLIRIGSFLGGEEGDLVVDVTSTTEAPLGCTNCHTIGPLVFLECVHFKAADPCQKWGCIRNTMNTDTCDPPIRTQNDCQAQLLRTKPKVKQELLNVEDCQSAVGWHTWRTNYYGKGDDCSTHSWRVRCDVAACSGAVLYSVNREPVIKCN